MPEYKPGDWNDNVTVTKINNCYNYATNKKNEPPAAGGKMPEGDEPGKSQKVTAKQFKGIVKKGKNIFPVFDYECDGVKAAAKVDGLKTPDANNECGSGCWLVSVHVRRLDLKKELFGDYHFLRKDSNGKWSHKPGDGPVTNQKYDKKSAKYNGGEITDPATDQVGIGPYIHCGYLCVCPDDVSVASALPLNEGVGSAAAVTLGGTMAANQTGQVSADVDAIAATIEETAEALGGQWLEGMGGGDLSLRIDLADGGSIFATDTALSVWDLQSLRHLDDPGGVGLARLADQLGLCVYGSGGLWEAVADLQSDVGTLAEASVDGERSSPGELIAWAALIAAVAIPAALIITGLLVR